MRHNRNDGDKTKLQTALQPNTGLESEARHAVVALLSILLADEIALKIKTRSIQWNGSGASFIELQMLFNSQYEQLSDICNEITIRERRLEGDANGSLQEYIDFTRLEQQPRMVPDLQLLLADHEAMTGLLRDESRKCAEENKDEDTFNLLVSVMHRHEKMAWMLRNYIQNQPVIKEKERNYSMNDRQLEKKIRMDAARVRKDISNLAEDGLVQLNRVENKVSQTSGKAKADLTAWVGKGLTQFGEGVEKVTGDAKETVMDTTAAVKKDIGRGLSQYNAKVQDAANQVPGGFGKKAARYPWVAVTIALMVGLLLGGVLRPVRQNHGQISA